MTTTDGAILYSAMTDDGEDLFDEEMFVEADDVDEYPYEIEVVLEDDTARWD